jgi:hypothetical protein
MRKCVMVFTLLLVLLTGCNSQNVVGNKEDEKNNIHNALFKYLSLIAEKDFERASEYVIYFTKKPQTVKDDVAKQIWVQRVKNQSSINSYLMSFKILSVEPSVDDKDFAQALVEMTTVEKGIKSTRNVYVHLERVNEKWKIGYYFREDHSMPDRMTTPYTGYISPEELNEPVENVREIAWDSLSKNEKEEVIGDWKDAEVSTVLVDEKRFELTDKSYVDKEVTMVTFHSNRSEILGDISKLIDKKTLKVIGAAYRE